MAATPLRSILSPTIQHISHRYSLGSFASPTSSILRRCIESFTRPVTITIPWTLQDIWESVLRAVPKKKTSYSKKRSRQLAGKALKDVTTLNKCPGCGRVKRAHTLCIYCVYDIKQIFKTKLRSIQQRPLSTQSTKDSTTKSTTKSTKSKGTEDPNGGKSDGVGEQATGHSSGPA